MPAEEISKSALETLINSFKEAALIVDKEGIILFANDVSAKRIGKTVKELDGASFCQLFPPDIAQRRRSHIEHIIRTAQPASFEDERDGRRYISYMSPLTDTQGNVEKVLIIAHDITEKKKLEDELMAEKEKLLILTDNAPFGMALIDANEKYLYINPKFKEMFGYDLDDIPDRDTWFKKAYPDEEYREKAISFWKQEIETSQVGRSTKRTFTITCEDGTKKRVEIASVILAAGLSLLTFVDITEKEKIETSYRSIFENATEGIYQTTVDGRFVIANPALIKILGYDSFEDLSENIKDVATQLYVNPYQRERLLEIIRGGSDVRGFETEVYRKDGTRIWISEGMSAVYDENNNIMYFQGIIEDITEKKRKEKELERLREQYNHAQKMEAIGTLTGGIAHDFNNFLTAIMGYTTLSQMKLNQDSHIKKYLDQIISVSNKMADLVKNLLAFSRRQPINLQPLDLNNEIKETKRLLKRLLTENIEIKIIASEKNPTIMADKTQLSQMLFNLTTNARDAMPDGGRFTLKIDTAKIDEDFIDTHGFGERGDYALISVSDTGCGIDREIMDKIFDPFFTTKETGKGTGLGLASVYGIVKQHSGFITVVSSPGKGATFNIYLPLVDMTTREDLKEKIEFPKGRGTILIGEDDENVRGFLKDVLEYHGYKTMDAQDGEKLVAIFKEEDNIDLVITDLIMPKKDGADAYNEIRSIKENTRFIFISGYDRDMLSKIPPDDKNIAFISKPISAEMLLRIINEMLPQLQTRTPEFLKED
ncbi:MAG: PAS domain S-box protein [Syntrophorhabdales bacterium]|nr:PAS domain S-box protein [Syntrophorhabdales bacterium]